MGQACKKVIAEFQRHLRLSVVWRTNLEVPPNGVPTLEARNSRMHYDPVVADESVEVWGVVRASVRNLQA
jgi:hypothetical protein